jgi:Ca2+-binding RTX toxin-like protein
VADPASTTAITIRGGGDAQTIIGNAGVNTIYARGADLVYGLGGDDVYYSFDARDRVYEAAGEGFDTIISRGSYVLQAGQHIERLVGVGSLTGNELAQTIEGGSSADTLNGGGGVDAVKFATVMPGSLVGASDFTII